MARTRAGFAAALDANPRAEFLGEMELALLRMQTLLPHVQAFKIPGAAFCVGFGAGSIGGENRCVYSTAGNTTDGGVGNLVSAI